jgi:hypothetical protein
VKTVTAAQKRIDKVAVFLAGWDGDVGPAFSALNRLKKELRILRMEQIEQHRRNRRNKVNHELVAYNQAQKRCANLNNPNYGGRGIKFLFTSFEQFFAEVGAKPTPKHSLDRFPDNDGNYEPGNVRWATSSQQNKNKYRKPVSSIPDVHLVQ